MTFPIICFDFDGTLVDERGQIHPKDLALLTDPQSPAEFICTTGRPLEPLRATLHKNGLFKDRPIRWPLVLQNGASIFAPGERKLEFSSFEPAIQKEIVAIARQFPQATFMFLSETEVHILGCHRLGLQFANRFEFVMHPFDVDSEGLPFSKVMCITESVSLLRSVFDLTHEFPVDGVYSFETVLEIIPKGVNKASGLKKLLKQLGREDDPFYAVGDGGNDLELLEQAFKSFAPKTAPDEIKRTVDQLVDVAKDGLFAPILKMICALEEENPDMVSG